MSESDQTTNADFYILYRTIITIILENQPTRHINKKKLGQVEACMTIEFDKKPKFISGGKQRAMMLKQR